MVKSKKTEKPTWLKMKEEELKKVITELAEKYSPAQIGTILRDQYGVPTTKVFGKSLSTYLKEIGKTDDYELKNIQNKVDRLKEHLKKNPTDKKAKHKSQKANSRLTIRKKYSARRK